MNHNHKFFRLVVLTLTVVLLAGGVHARAERPLIGVSAKCDDPHEYDLVPADYAKAIIQAGGIPVYVPVTSDQTTLESMVDRLDGLVMTGGGDIPPSAYGEKPVEQVKEMPAKRFEFDQKLIKLWLASKKPMLGVCLGMQQTNVATGGSMIQDIPTMVGKKVIHRDPETKDFVMHPIHIAKGSLLYKITGAETFEVDSCHHQAVKRLSNQVRTSAKSADGVVEALELTEHPWGLLVQFHPERMTDKAAGQAIFKAFVEACKEKKK